MSERFRSYALAFFQLLERAWPVFAQQTRQRAIRKQSAASLTGRAVIGFVCRVDDALHRRSAVGARLAIAAVNGHLFVKRGDLLGKLVTRLIAKPGNPLEQGDARRLIQAPYFVVGERLRLLER